MTGDRTLDDFAGRASEATDEETAATPDKESEEMGESEETKEIGGPDEESEETPDAPLDSSADPEAEPTEPEPAVSTYRWSPDGAICDDCGEPVERRWLDDGSYVCAACKEW